MGAVSFVGQLPRQMAELQHVYMAYVQDPQDHLAKRSAWRFDLNIYAYEETATEIWLARSIQSAQVP